MSTIDKVRVYTPHGVVAHLATSGNENVTLCDLWNPFGLYGTGSQDEYEKAEELPLCKRCRARVGGTP